MIQRYFTADEMNLMLGDALKKESLEPDKPERYWTTLISAYSGARLNEICQLDVKDIQEFDGIWTINLNANSADMSLKTRSWQ